MQKKGMCELKSDQFCQPYRQKLQILTFKTIYMRKTIVFSKNASTYTTILSEN